MKKSIAILSLVAFSTIFMSSCKKDYTCECVFTNGTPTISLPIEKAKKGDAEDTCDAAKSTYTLADPAVSCKLK